MPRARRNKQLSSHTGSRAVGVWIAMAACALVAATVPVETGPAPTLALLGGPIEWVLDLLAPLRHFAWWTPDVQPARRVASRWTLWERAMLGAFVPLVWVVVRAVRDRSWRQRVLAAEAKVFAAVRDPQRRRSVGMGLPRAESEAQATARAFLSQLSDARDGLEPAASEGPEQPSAQPMLPAHVGGGQSG